MINRIPNERIYEAARIVFEEAARDNKQMAFAVTDEAGGLVFATRTDKCAARVLQHAVRKAYTAAVMRRDTLVFRDENLAKGKTLADWGDPTLTQLQGGLVVNMNGELYGGMAVGGNEAERDEEIAHLVLKALVS